LHLLDVLSGNELDTLVLEPLQAQSRGCGHARMRRWQNMQDKLRSHARGSLPVPEPGDRLGQQSRLILGRKAEGVWYQGDLAIGQRGRVALRVSEREDLVLRPPREQHRALELGDQTPSGVVHWTR